MPSCAQSHLEFSAGKAYRPRKQSREKNEIITTVNNDALFVAGLCLATMWLKLTVRPGTSLVPSARVIPLPILTKNAKQRTVQREITSVQIDLVITEPSRARAGV